ncbi:MAG: hypothetical protein R3E98_15065 [Gemmatimonadota bacterium]
MAIVAVVSGALVAGLHASELPFLARPLGLCPDGTPLYDCAIPVWTHAAAGALGAGVFFLLLLPLVPLAGRRVRPSVYCRGCDRMGWVADLVGTNGRCPHCGSERHDFFVMDVRAVFLGGSTLFLPRQEVLADVTGSALLERDDGSRPAPTS